MEEKENGVLIDNKKIVDENLELLKTCVDMQFIKLCKTDPWKRQYKDDLLNDIVLVLYNYDPVKLNDAYQNKHMNALITRIILNQIYSNTSSFYLQYLKFQGKCNNIRTYDDEEREEWAGFATPDDKYESY